jgi:acyl carrier protein
MNKEQFVEQQIIEILTEINESLPEDEQISVSPNTVLFGNGALIDSLSLVSLIVDLETKLSMDFDKEIVLTDDRAMTRKISPFENVQTLKEYILELVG